MRKIVTTEDTDKIHDYQADWEAPFAPDFEVVYHIYEAGMVLTSEKLKYQKLIACPAIDMWNRGLR
jgi:hypothetical protein